MDRDFREPYRWLAAQMKRRGICHPRARYPLWAWYQYQYDGKKLKRPDLRNSCFGLTGTELVLLQIDLPDSEVLLSDHELWHYPLTFSYLPTSVADERRFDRRYPEPPGAIVERRVRSTAARRRALEASWQKIFDLDWTAKDFAAPRSKKGIQANFWELRADQVVSMRHFIAR